jgi:hypothetical protein
MVRLRALLLLFLAILVVPAAASAQDKAGGDSQVIEGLRDKGVDWLKDKAKDAGQDWVFETGQSETMHEILLAARERADGEGNDKSGLCQGAVMGKASSILNDINTKWTVKTAGRLAFDTVTKMAGLASGFGAAAAEGDAINWVVGQYADAAKGQAKDTVFDRIKKLFVDEKKPEFEVYETSGTNGPCDYTLRAAWDIVHGSYRIYIAGDCHCKEVGNAGVAPRPLGKWWISFEGHLKLSVDKAKGTTTWIVLPPIMEFDAQCACSKRELRKAFARAEKQQSATTTGGGTTTPSPGGSTTPTGPAPLPPAGRKVCKECQKIQADIDADTQALEDVNAQIKTLAEQLAGAKGKLGSDRDRLADVKANPKDYDITPGAVQKQVEEDERAVKSIEDDGKKALDEKLRLESELRGLAKLLEDCIRTHCPEGHSSIVKPVHEVPVAAPAPSEVAYHPDSFATRVLTIHNVERAEVGSPPLEWNQQLATDAAVYATQLARTGELVHAPREGRGTERENLLRTPIGYTPDQMMNIWVSEKRYFHPGIFPNVCTGDWSQCAHYTQMIWPTTIELGCGMAPGGGFNWLVCRYSPGGNKDGEPVGQATYRLERGR